MSTTDTRDDTDRDRSDFGRTYDLPTLGSDVFHFGDEDLPHLDGKVVRVPEGFMIQAVCRECGWRDETVLVLPEPEECLDQNGVLSPAAGHSFASGLQSRVDSLVGRHFPEHRPESHEGNESLPGELLDLERKCIDATRTDLANGQRVAGTAYVLLASGKSFPVGLMPLSGQASSQSERNRIIEQAKAGVRNYVSELEDRGRELVGAVFVGEFWTSDRAPEDGAVRPSEDPDRDEVVLVQTFTRSTGRTRWAPIVRTGGARADGPGKLGEWNILAYCGGRFADGLISPLEQVKLRSGSAPGSPLASRTRRAG